MLKEKITVIHNILDGDKKIIKNAPVLRKVSKEILYILDNNLALVANTKKLSLASYGYS